MKKEIIEFKNECGGYLPMIIAHYVDIGRRNAASITEKYLAKVRADLEAEEQEARKHGQVMIMTPDFQCFLLKQCKKLADLSKDRELTVDVNLLIAQYLVPTDALLAETDFSAIQKAYWAQVITQYVESWCDDDEREEFERLLEEDGLEEVIDQILNDDEIWGCIDNGLEYYISHLK